MIGLIYIGVNYDPIPIDRTILILKSLDFIGWKKEEKKNPMFLALFPLTLWERVGGGFEGKISLTPRLGKKSTPHIILAAWSLNLKF